MAITQDNTAPGLVRHQNSDGSIAAWGANDVESGDGYTVVSWEPPADTDVAGYFVYYGFVGGANPNVYTGTFANEGTSPINVGSPCKANPTGNDCSVRLTGAADETAYYVALAAYDKTIVPGPNIGALVSGQMTTPAPIVTTLVANVPVTSLSTNPNAKVRGVAVRDGLIFVASGNNDDSSGANPNGDFAIVDGSTPGVRTSSP